MSEVVQAQATTPPRYNSQALGTSSRSHAIGSISWLLYLYDYALLILVKLRGAARSITPNRDVAEEHHSDLSILIQPHTRIHPYVESSHHVLEDSQEPEFPRSTDHDDATSITPATTSTSSNQASQIQILLNTNGEQSSNGPFFNQASDFVLNHPVMVSNNHHHVEFNKTLKILLKYTVLGADFNSSERDPPPRCHPKTRVALRQRLFNWAVGLEAREKSFVWLKGPAGTGKSAVMQSIAESVFLDREDKIAPGASFFFWRCDSSGNRSDSRRLFTTMAYQLSTHCNPYRDYMLSELSNDPKLPERAIKIQFSRFITRPFVNMGIYSEIQPIIIIIDGLDECKGEREQCEIIQLIASFVTDHPAAPLLWLVSSRPESHLEAMFERSEIHSTYKAEEILVDSIESCADVERYLRSEFTEIRLKNPRTIPTSYQWPTESQFMTVAGGAGGLFAFASTVISFIDDPDYQDPRTLLDQVLNTIKTASDGEREEESRNPFAYLDALYSFIMSTVPEDVFPITKKLLLLILDRYHLIGSFPIAINFLQLATHQGLSALHKLNSVLRPGSALGSLHTCWHKSFADFLGDESRSRIYYMSPNDSQEEFMLNCGRIQCEIINGNYKIDSIQLTSPDETKFSDLKNRLIRLEIMLLSMLHCVYSTRYPLKETIMDPSSDNFRDFPAVDWSIYPPCRFFTKVFELVLFFLIEIEDQSIGTIHELRIEDINLKGYGMLAIASLFGGIGISPTTDSYDNLDTLDFLRSTVRRN